MPEHGSFTDHAPNAPFVALPQRAHFSYLRAVVESLEPHAGSTAWDDTLAGWSGGGEEVMLLECWVEIAGGVWTLGWDQVTGWWYAVGDLEEHLGERHQLIDGALVPRPQDVVRAARALAAGDAHLLPLHEDETPLPLQAALTPAQQEFLDFGYITTEVAHRLTVYSVAEQAAAPDH
ncbi:hypothetical protein [Streptomyces sp. NPDC059003]|uniref:hypothetical protein n=1 Tax=Streptomyces sp. NPDC059003 TaxID=3346691 RepID=UPI0036B4CE9F